MSIPETVIDGTGEEHNVEELMHASLFDLAQYFPTSCPRGCEVESDGRCPHGAPSLLLELGLA